MRGQSPHKSGFTLIEIAVVLVIIGLIVGGVVVGQDLIKAAQLRAVISEVEKYKTAVMTFKGKYDCLPGDCANATSFFGTPWAGVTTDSAGNVITNGDGNGLIDQLAACSDPGRHESWEAWHHLSLAGLITGSFTGNGVCGPESCTDSLVGADLPVSNALGGSSGYFLGATYVGVEGIPLDDMYPGVSNHAFILGNQDVAGGDLWDMCSFNGPWLPVLSPGDAASLDKKIDDGLPSTGSVTVFKPSSSFNPTCVSGTSYNIAGGAAPQCTMVFGFGL